MKRRTVTVTDRGAACGNHKPADLPTLGRRTCAKKGTQPPQHSLNSCGKASILIKHQSKLEIGTLPTSLCVDQSSLSNTYYSSLSLEICSLSCYIMSALSSNKELRKRILRSNPLVCRPGIYRRPASLCQLIARSVCYAKIHIPR
jgi:hypothetical protein